MKNVSLKIDDSWMSKINTFLEKRKENIEMYQLRGAFKEEDIKVGAMGEVACYLFLKSQGIDVSRPDFSILENKEKSYMADLVGDYFHIHIKSQSGGSEDRFGRSWLFQKTDPLITTTNSRDYVMLTTVRGDEVHLHGVYQGDYLAAMLKECRLKGLQVTKKALYFEDIESSLTPWERWQGLYTIGNIK